MTVVSEILWDFGALILVCLGSVEKKSLHSMKTPEIRFCNTLFIFCFTLFCFLLYTLRCVSVFLSNFPWFPIYFRYWNDSKLRTRLFIRLRNDLTLCRQDSGQFGLILWYNLIVFFLIVEGRGENEERKREPRVEGGGGANSKRQERITEKL